VKLDDLDQWRHLPGVHGGHPRQSHRHLLQLDASESTTLAACLGIKGNAVTADQQIGTDLLTETHPPTLSDLIAGLIVLRACSLA
jgi:hypothetical protein